VPLESASFISDLNTANPAPTDLLAQGDDHIRLIKAVLKATFPNVAGAVTLTHTDLNSILATISGAGVPTGCINAWYGSSGSVPAGWHICDGTTGIARSDGAGTIDVPDLRNLVIMGAGTVAPQGTAFGAANQSAPSAAAGAHSHSTNAGEGGHAHTGVTTAGHALTTAELPAHKHLNGIADDLTRLFTRGTGPVASSTGYTVKDETGFTPNYEGYTETVGGGAAHSHDMSWPVTPDGTHTHTTDAVAAHTHGVTLPVYQPALALHYIMKV
jgi:hypothetical protein